LTGPRHILVIANQTVGGHVLIDAVRKAAADGDALVTVLAPINQPQRGYVVYEDTRRASAGRRLERALDALREAGIRANGMVVDCEPAAAARDALAQLEPPVTQILVSTFPEQKSGWLRRNVVDQIRRAAGAIPVEHVVGEPSPGEGGQANVLVLANETVIGRPLLDRIRRRAAQGPTGFLIVSPQSDPSGGAHPEAERRLKRALTELRSEGINAHGQIARPDPFSAAMEAFEEERIDEILVSTFEPARSGWLRRDLVERLRAATKLPVEHVVVEAAEVEGVPA
jgi:hypothetical protein